MNTLLLRLAGPMQSWGVQSRFSVRDTGLEPSKSGVLGLVCAAMGIPRGDDDALARLAGLRLGVRTDREGRLSRDYHIALNVLKAGGGIKPSEPSTRYYLADAVFLVGLEGNDLSLLEDIHAALNKPVWPLFLGRKAFVPAEPVYLEDGLKKGAGLVDALCSYPYLGRGERPKHLRLVLEDPNGEFFRPDQPLSFASRRFAPRRVHVIFTDSLPSYSEVM
jgi:CRISPR system Cascade subunit CasD